MSSSVPKNLGRGPQVSATAAPAGPAAPKVPGAQAAPGAPAAPGAAAKSLEKGKELLKNMWETKGPVLIFILAVILVFIIVILYISFAMKNSNLSGKKLTSRPIKLNEVSVPYEIPGTDIPVPAVGREYSYSFWLYVDQFEQTPGNNKLIFYRGTKDDITLANPLVMLDTSENRLFVCIKTQDNTLSPADIRASGNSTAMDLRNIVSKNYFKNPMLAGAGSNKYIIMEVDYVPLQRWVNFTLIVDNKIMSLFLDGEIYSVKSVDELKSSRKPELDDNGQPIRYNLIVDKTEGNIYVGKNSVNNKVTVNGFLSNLEFHNYAISLNQVKAIYNQGPLSKGGVLGSMGLQYGIRSPVYKINDSTDA